MSANGNEAVTLSQLKEALSQSSQSGTTLSLKPLYRSDNIDNLTDISDTGIYYKVEGGTYQGTLPFGGSTPFCVLVFPIMWMASVHLMGQILVANGAAMYIRTVEPDGRLSSWMKYSYTATHV